MVLRELRDLCGSPPHYTTSLFAHNSRKVPRETQRSMLIDSHLQPRFIVPVPLIRLEDPS